MSEWGCPTVDLRDYENRKDEIREELWQKATQVGFIQVINHGIPQDEIDKMFAMSAKFFALPANVKSKIPWDKATNNGWEAGSEVLDESTADLKETYNVGFANMDGKFLDESDIGGFKEQVQHFQRLCEGVSWKLLSCFALKLGFPEDFFKQHHDGSKPDCTKLLRLLYYPAVTEEQVKSYKPGQMRAGEHTDYGCVTLLFQQKDQPGLEVCPGADTTRQNWVPVEPTEGAIVINIGDSLMRWSDDQLKSNIHRVRVPRLGDPLHARYSIAFFNQPNGSAVIEGPNHKYPTITAHDYLQHRLTVTYK